MNEEKEIRVLIVAPIWMTFRNLFASGFVHKLVRSNFNISLVSFISKEDFQKLDCKDQIDQYFEYSKEAPRNIAFLATQRLLNIIFVKYSATYKQKLKQKHKFCTIFISTLLSVIPNIICFNIVRALRILCCMTLNVNYEKKLIAKGNYDLILCSSALGDGLRSFDKSFMLAAKKLKCKSILIQASWDNITSKGFYIVQADITVVWNTQMKYECINTQLISQDSVKVLGSLTHYYMYRYGKDISNSIEKSMVPRILYTMAGVNTVKNELLVIDKLYKILDEIYDNRFSLTIRAHPVSGNLDLLIRYAEKHKNVVLTAVSKNSDPNKLGIPMLRRDLDTLVNTIQMNCVIVNICSTINIDGTLLNKPVINLIWDLSKEDFNTSIGFEFINWSHNKMLIEMDVVNTPKSLSELVEILKNPENYTISDKQHSQFCENFLGITQCDMYQAYINLLKDQYNDRQYST